jgi:hypothetical protein
VGIFDFALNFRNQRAFRAIGFRFAMKLLNAFRYSFEGRTRDLKRSNSNSSFELWSSSEVAAQEALIVRLKQLVEDSDLSFYQIASFIGTLAQSRVCGLPKEVERLVGEFVSSGMRRAEICRENDLALNNLNRHLRRGKEKRKQVLK